MTQDQIVFIGILCIPIAIYILRRTVQVVPKHQHWYVPLCSTTYRLLLPGVRFIIPFSQSVTAKVQLTEQSKQLYNLSTRSLQDEFMAYDLAYAYQVFDSKRAALSVVDTHKSVERLLIGSTNTKLGKHSLNELWSDNSTVANGIRNEINDSLKVWGIRITRFDIRPPC